MTQPAPTRQFFQVNMWFICEQCNPSWNMLISSDSATSSVVITRLNPEQLRDMQAECYVSECDRCGTPFFTRTQP